jgi:hypothetical protein
LFADLAWRREQIALEESGGFEDRSPRGRLAMTFAPYVQNFVFRIKTLIPPLWWFGLAVAAFTLIAYRPAHATPILVGGAVGDGWVVDNIDAGVTLDFTAHTAASSNSGTRGRLAVEVTHLDFTTKKFGLRQTTPIGQIGSTSTSGGLRLLMDVTATNSSLTGSSWIGYVIATDDRSHVANAGGVGDHLADAHFHNTPTGFGGDPLVLMGNGDNVPLLNFGLGFPVDPPDGFEKVSNILLHERHFADTQRVFDVLLHPVPEPGTLLLLSAAVLGLGVASRRRPRCSETSRQVHPW